MRPEIGFMIILFQLVRRKEPDYCIEKNCKFQVGFRGRVPGGCC